MAQFEFVRGLWTLNRNMDEWTEPEKEIHMHYTMGGQTNYLDNELCRMNEEASRQGYKRLRTGRNIYGYALYGNASEGRVSVNVDTPDEIMAKAKAFEDERPGFHFVDMGYELTQGMAAAEAIGAVFTKLAEQTEEGEGMLPIVVVDSYAKAQALDLTSVPAFALTGGTDSVADRSIYTIEKGARGWEIRQYILRTWTSVGTGLYPNDVNAGTFYVSMHTFATLPAAKGGATRYYGWKDKAKNAQTLGELLGAVLAKHADKIMKDEALQAAQAMGALFTGLAAAPALAPMAGGQEEEGAGSEPAALPAARTLGVFSDRRKTVAYHKNGLRDYAIFDVAPVESENGAQTGRHHYEVWAWSKHSNTGYRFCTFHLPAASPGEARLTFAGLAGITPEQVTAEGATEFQAILPVDTGEGTAERAIAIAHIGKRMAAIASHIKPAPARNGVNMVVGMVDLAATLGLISDSEGVSLTAQAGDQLWDHRPDKGQDLPPMGGGQPEEGEGAGETPAAPATERVARLGRLAGALCHAIDSTISTIDGQLCLYEGRKLVAIPWEKIRALVSGVVADRMAACEELTADLAAEEAYLNGGAPVIDPEELARVQAEAEETRALIQGAMEEGGADQPAAPAIDDNLLKLAEYAFQGVVLATANKRRLVMAYQQVTGREVLAVEMDEQGAEGLKVAGVATLVYWKQVRDVLLGAARPAGEESDHVALLEGALEEIGQRVPDFKLEAWAELVKQYATDMAQRFAGEEETAAQPTVEELTRAGAMVIAMAMKRGGQAAVTEEGRQSLARYFFKLHGMELISANRNVVMGHDSNGQAKGALWPEVIALVLAQDDEQKA